MQRRLSLDLHIKGEVIKPGCIDFTRFNRWPVVLNQHKKEIAIGLARDVAYNESGLSFTVEFNDITESAKYMNFLYNEGLVVAKSGGFVNKRDADGNITEFDLFEISLCKKS